jgi:hypothetical protein
VELRGTRALGGPHRFLKCGLAACALVAKMGSIDCVFARHHTDKSHHFVLTGEKPRLIAKARRQSHRPGIQRGFNKRFHPRELLGRWFCSRSAHLLADRVVANQCCDVDAQLHPLELAEERGNV